jgi:hypothetical protein
VNDGKIEQPRKLPVFIAKRVVHTPGAPFNRLLFAFMIKMPNSIMLG